MPFRDFAEIWEPLRLPYNGKTYELPSVGIADGGTLSMALDPRFDTPMPDPAELERMLLGPVVAEMKADNVPGPFALRVLMTALADFQSGRAAAEVIWETGADPKAVEAWTRAAVSEPSTSTGEENETP